MSHECPRRLESGSVGFDKWQAGGTCSYCGSISGDRFMELARARTQLGPTDKGYKVYIDGAGKFYFQHLSEEQKHEFLALLTTHDLHIGYPGHFYVLPYFIGRKTPNDHS